MHLPTTLKEVRQFLEIGGYCWEWIPNFSLILKPLIMLTHSDIIDPVPFDDKCLEASLWENVCNEPTLRMPDYNMELLALLPHALSFLTQKLGGVMRPIGCLSAVCGSSSCLHWIKQREEIVIGHTLTVFVPHTHPQTQHMTKSCLTKYEQVILAAENTSLRRGSFLNPAMLYPASDSNEDKSDDDNDEQSMVALMSQSHVPSQGHTLDNDLLKWLIWFSL